MGIWAGFGNGLGAKNLAEIASFGAACMSAVLIEPLADIGIMVLTKWARRMTDSAAVDNRLYNAVQGERPPWK